MIPAPGVFVQRLTDTYSALCVLVSERLRVHCVRKTSTYACLTDFRLLVHSTVMVKLSVLYVSLAEVGGLTLFAVLKSTELEMQRITIRVEEVEGGGGGVLKVDRETSVYDCKNDGSIRRAVLGTQGNGSAH